MEDTIIAMNGVLLSPSALKIHAHILYAKVVSKPPNKIYPYVILSFMIKLDVCKKFNKVRRNTILITDSTIPIPRDNFRAEAMTLLNS